VLTESDIDQLAQEAEAGYPIDKLVPRRRTGDAEKD
jgi:hypothetical protein